MQDMSVAPGYIVQIALLAESVTLYLSSSALILIRGSAVEVSMGRIASGVLCGWGWWLVG
jgi:hypothetical protein